MALWFHIMVKDKGKDKARVNCFILWCLGLRGNTVIERQQKAMYRKGYG